MNSPLTFSIIVVETEVISLSINYFCFGRTFSRWLELPWINLSLVLLLLSLLRIGILLRLALVSVFGLQLECRLELLDVSFQGNNAFILRTRLGPEVASLAV